MSNLVQQVSRSALAITRMIGLNVSLPGGANMSMTRSRHLTILVCFLGAASAALAEAAPPQTETPGFSNPTGPLSLSDSLALALEQNLDLEVFSWDIRAAEARAIQAGLRPNPELSLEVEDLRLGSGPATRSSRIGLSTGFTPEFERARESGSEPGLSEAELTLRISQLIELGGKRSKRVRLANRERDTAAWDYEVARLNVLSETARAFYTVLAAQERVRLADELDVLARQTLDTVIARVDAGKVSPIQRTQGEAEYAIVKMDVERTRRELEAARVQLAALWGASSAEFTQADGALGPIDTLPPLESIQARAEATPDVSRWMAEIEQRDAVLDLERATAKPDLSVTLGLRSTQLGSSEESSYGLSGAGDWSYSRGRSGPEESREESVVLGFSLPLPLFNRNQGRILEAEHLASKAAALQRAGKVRIQASLSAAYSALESSRATMQVLGTEVLPKAREAFDATNEGYRQGKFGLLEVLVAQRGLFEARSRMLDAQAAYAQQIVDIERLSGQPLLPLAETNELHEEQP